MAAVRRNGCPVGEIIQEEEAKNESAGWFEHVLQYWKVRSLVL